MSKNILKQNSLPLGIAIGLILPVLFFAVLYIIDYSLFYFFGNHLTSQFDFLFLFSIIANLFPIRHYLVNLKFEKPGMGILAVTIVEIVLYFFLFYKP